MSKKDTRISNKDIQVAYLVNGISGVEDLTASNVPAKATLQAAVDSLDNLGQDTEDLVDFMDTLHPSNGDGQRGRSAPKNGDTRTYKAQSVNGGSCFLRLPLDTLNAIKGQSITVSFEDGRVVVSG